MHVSFTLITAGLLVGFLVGLTGMGGGALMTPILIFFFGIAPLAAVSSDLVASLFMKPVGAAVHLRRGTVDRRLVLCLTAGAAPAAFVGVLVLTALGEGGNGEGGNGARVQDDIRVFLGAALLLTVASMVVKPWISRRRERAAAHAGLAAGGARPQPGLVIRPVLTVAIGVLGGFAVGMTSVGSGSLIIGMLLLAYPTLRAGQLVGTDLVQAIPLVGAAAIGHAVFGDVQLSVTSWLLVGAIPAVYVGARLSASGANRFVRPVLAVVLLASALKLVHTGTDLTVALCGAWVLANAAVAAVRRRAAKSIRRRTAKSTALAGEGLSEAGLA